MFKKRILNNKKQVKIGINEETEEDKLWITLFIFINIILLKYESYFIFIY